MRQRGMTIERGHRYHILFRAHASAPTTVRPKVGMQGAPYAEYWFATLQLDPRPRVFEGTFMMEGRRRLEAHAPPVPTRRPGALAFSTSAVCLGQRTSSTGQR